MSPEGKVKVLVKSKRVPVRTVVVHQPIYSLSGLRLGTQTISSVLYDNAYEDSQQKAIDQARRLSCNLGLDFEVVDKSTSSFFRRIFLALRNSQSANPSVVLAPSTYGDSERHAPDSLV